MEKGQFYRVFLGSFEILTDNERYKKYEIEVTMPKGCQNPKTAYHCPYILCFEKQDNHVVLVVYSDEQKWIVDTVIDGEESSPSEFTVLDSAKRSDLISRKEVLYILKNVFDEYRMSYGKQYKGFAADVPAEIWCIG